MKRFGLWLALLVVLLAVGGMILASRLVLIRGSWQKKTAEAKAKVLDLRVKAAELERVVAVAKGDLQRLIHDWERYWIAPQVVAGRQPGTLAVALGTNQGLTANTVVYAFQPSADGAGMEFVGPFKVSAVQETQAALTPNWRLRPNEEQSWRLGPNWRFRSNIPDEHKTQFADFELMMLRKDELLAGQQKHLQIQQEAKAKAEEHLDQRMKELNGDPKNANKNLDKYLVVGYHAAVADMEQERNKVQGEVDELRRRIKRTHDEIERLKRENERLADQLSGEAPRTAINSR
jgi:hypothetical protein